MADTCPTSVRLRLGPLAHQLVLWLVGEMLEATALEAVALEAAALEAVALEAAALEAAARLAAVPHLLLVPRLRQSPPQAAVAVPRLWQSVPRLR
jgi:hypothetical protein